MILFAEAKYFDQEKQKAAEAAQARERSRAAQAVAGEQSKRKRQEGQGSQPAKRTKTSLDTAVAQPAELSVTEELRAAFKAAMPKESQQRGRVKQTFDTREQKLGPEMDALINAANRPFKCYRAPVTAFYENDRRGA